MLFFDGASHMVWREGSNSPPKCENLKMCIRYSRPGEHQKWQKTYFCVYLGKVNIKYSLGHIRECSSKIVKHLIQFYIVGITKCIQISKYL